MFIPLFFFRHLNGLFRANAFLVYLSVCVFIIGCTPQAEKNTEKKTSPTHQKPITQPEAHQFAETLEKALIHRKPEFFIRAINWSGITDKILTGIPENRKQETYNREKLYESLCLSGGVAAEVGEKVSQGGAYQFLRSGNFLNPESLPWVMFRYLDPQGGLDYHKLFLARDSTGAICVEDILLVHFNETLSDSLRRMLAPELYAGGTAGHGVPMSQVVQILFREKYEEFAKMTTALQEGNYQRVLDIYDSLPVQLQENKTLEMLRLNAAQNLPDTEQYMFILADLRKKMKGDPTLDFISLDYFFGRKRFTEVLQCLERIEKVVGEDPYLNLFRCNALIQLERYDEAEKLYLFSLQDDPRLNRDPLFRNIALRIALARKDYPRVTMVLNALQRDFRFPPPNLNHPQFLEYKTWLENTSPTHIPNAFP